MFRRASENDLVTFSKVCTLPLKLDEATGNANRIFDTLVKTPVFSGGLATYTKLMILRCNQWIPCYTKLMILSRHTPSNVTCLFQTIRLTPM